MSHTSIPAGPSHGLNPDGSEFSAGTAKRRKPLILIVTLVAAILLGSGAYLLYGMFGSSQKPVEPVAAGSMLIIPDNVDAGGEFTLGENGDEVTPEGVTYENPTSGDEYRTVDANGNVTYKVPIDGSCPVAENGVIGAPNNFRHACSYAHNGAVVYTAHAVRGPRVGAFEHIGSLQVGQKVTLDSQDYVVESVATFPATKLPEYMFQPGNVMLLTCHIDAAVDKGAPFDKSDVVFLKKV